MGRLGRGGRSACGGVGRRKVGREVGVGRSNKKAAEAEVRNASESVSASVSVSGKRSGIGGRGDLDEVVVAPAAAADSDV